MARPCDAALSLALVAVLLIVGTHAQGYESPNIYQAISDIPEYSYFSAILANSGLKERLVDPSFVGTVFAPINPAFVNLSKIMDQPLDKLLANPGMNTIASYHIVPGVAYSVSPFNGQPLQDHQKMLTIEGGVLTIDKTTSRGYTLVVGDNNYGSIISQDIRGGKAMLQVLDTVLIPSTNSTAKPVATDDNV